MTLPDPWKFCAADGTPFFIASEAFPLGRPAGSRHCSEACAAHRRQSNEFVLDVDGTLGAEQERRSGGPRIVAGMAVDEAELGIRRGAVHLGEPFTAIPKGGR